MSARCSRPSAGFTLRALFAAGAPCVLFACGPKTVDHTPDGNLLDVDTQSIEGSVGHWQAWYSTDVTRSTHGAQNGQASLRIEITERFGWGVSLDNWPGFPAAPGRHRAELWARSVAGSALDLSVSLYFRDESGGDLDKTVVRMPLDRSWRKLGSDLTAPSGTMRVWVELTGGEGEPGDAIEVDEIYVL
jgi:hypothetical protein